MAQPRTNRANDLRAFIEELRDAGDLREISGADWNLEIGAITELLGEEDGPGVLSGPITWPTATAC
jgi:3-polyprenyl-4-hydroxybenzoate decarboxylase